MRCYYHPEVDAVATCTDCGKAICQSCAVNVAGRLLCQQCLASGTAIRGRATESVPTNPLAIVSLVLGILGLLGCVCGGSIGGILFGVPAGITGWLARKQLLQAEQSRQGLQLATVGLILGIAEVVLGIVVLVVFGSIYGLAFLSELLRQSSY